MKEQIFKYEFINIYMNLFIPNLLYSIILKLVNYTINRIIKYI
jgi:hypothetical protein